MIKELLFVDDEIIYSIIFLNYYIIYLSNKEADDPIVFKNTIELFAGML